MPLQSLVDSVQDAFSHSSAGCPALAVPSQGFSVCSGWCCGYVVLFFPAAARKRGWWWRRKGRTPLMWSAVSAEQRSPGAPAPAALGGAGLARGCCWERRVWPHCWH